MACEFGSAHLFQRISSFVMALARARIIAYDTRTPMGQCAARVSGSGGERRGPAPVRSPISTSTMASASRAPKASPCGERHLGGG
ncbi:MAG: hypothetical protein SGPRY_013025 [Prymnesium sp.]